MKRLAMLSGMLLLWAYGYSQEYVPVFSEKPWSIGLHLGFSTISPAGSLEEVMKKHEFDVTTFCFFFCDGPIAHPHTKKVPDIWLELDYRLKPSFSLGGVFGSTALGETMGYHEDFKYLFIRYNQITLAPRARWSTEDDAMSFYAGPSLNLVILERTDAGPDYNRSAERNLLPGFISGLGLTILNKKVFYLRFSAMYSLSAWKVAFGPLEMDYYGTIPENPEIIFPEEKVFFHNLSVGISLGFKFSGN